MNQIQLQELTYIAHGWCLALTDQPLTGDRPEAMDFGPEYRRLAEALARWGVRPVTAEICPSVAELSATEHSILAKVYSEYGSLKTAQLAAITRSDDAPWAQVFAGGAGKARDIHHKLIQSQFAEFAHGQPPAHRSE